MELPKQYQWMLKLDGPRCMTEAIKLYGIREVKGLGKSNPKILEMARTLGLQKEYLDDDTAWCGLSMAYVMHCAGLPVVKNPLWALNWADWGNPVGVPMYGDVLTFKRFDKNGKLIGGHVGFYVGETDTTYFVLAGNQSDMYCIVEIAKNRLYRARRTPWKIAQPESVRVNKLTSTGKLSVNEA